MPSRVRSETAVRPAAIPYLGTSWVDRGAGYWWRRLLYALRWLVFYGFGSVMAIGVFLALVSDLSPQHRRVADTVEIAAASVCLVVGWVLQFRHSRSTPVPTPDEAWKRKRRFDEGKWRMQALRPLGILAAPAAPLLVPLLIGNTLPRVLSRRFPSEIGARRDYEERLAEARSRVPLRKKHH